jgi:hypothetical protein
MFDDLATAESVGSFFKKEVRDTACEKISDLTDWEEDA